jgi:hypothetical protein
MGLFPEITRGRKSRDEDFVAPLVSELETIGSWKLWYADWAYPGYLTPPTFVFSYPKVNQPLQTVIAFPGTRTAGDLAFSIESLQPVWTHSLLMAVIPFYRLTRGLFFSLYESDLSENVAIIFAGPRRLSVNYWFKGIWFTHAMSRRFQVDPWVRAWANHSTGTEDIIVKALVGYGCYGLFAKGLAWAYPLTGMAFDSPQFFDSPVETWEVFAEGTPSTAGATKDFSSGSSLLVSSDQPSFISQTYEMPQFWGPFHPRMTEEVFCLVAAGCAVTERYDGLCEQFVGKERFNEMFVKWGRPRTLNGTRQPD